MEQRFRRPVAVPDLTCEQCQQLAQELEAKTEIIRKLSVDNTRMAEEVSGALQAAAAAGKEVANLKRQKTRRAREDAKAEDIQKVADYWLETHKRAKVPEGDKRWETIRKALMVHSVDECIEALEGLRLAPYQQYEQRFAVAGPGRVLRNDVEHALGTEQRFERCRSIAQQAKASALDEMFRRWEVTGQIHDAHCRLLMSKLHERPEEEVLEVDGLVVRP